MDQTQTLSFWQRLVLAFVAFYYALADLRFAVALQAYRERRRAHPGEAGPVGLEPAPVAKPVPAPEPVKAAPPPPPAAKPVEPVAPPRAPEPPKPVEPVEPPRAVEPPKPPPAPARPDGEEALHLLTILQRDGRLVDFCSEDLAGFSDAEIGAAARTVHAGCKKAIDGYFRLEPIYREPEGARVTVAPGFDAASVRLTGNVVGTAPFTGALRHHGWRAVSVKLPTPPAAGREIVAPAEVEL
ncbi:DUF2760 domain-containing protein [Anaeromyxobacter paludicola]|uniref:DUF2760 domain-containing protein n=1 Tax=Anaeromyxobacter paludicola TaxID=2918171 RepID=A0ABM7XFI9_9BACT|nr:DUF2760 domain-containing protein [Anaeromyxobacter paludicola]BDG10672.1 hypothetical protein AMPC_37850 [Anaeromyxobacter paludicola]